MIYIKEIFPHKDSVVIQVDGILDDESIEILKEVCQRHLESKKKIELNLQGLMYIFREGRDFLREIQDKINIRPPGLIRLEKNR